MRDEIRIRAAELARAIRAMWPSLDGQWSRRDWNNQTRISIKHFLHNTRKFLAANKEK